jgi:hypothetical protein
MNFSKFFASATLDGEEHLMEHHPLGSSGHNVSVADLGCNIWLADTADLPPRALKDNEGLDLGGKRVRWLDTPHVPHN